MMIENKRNWLQRFAGSGTGAAGDAGAGNTVPDADAGQHAGGAAGGAANGPAAADREAGNAQSAAGEAPLPPFEELIKGRYKADFEARVQDIVSEQLARARQSGAAAAKMQGVVDVLARRYGRDGTDYDGILQAMNGDAALRESGAAGAAADGMDVQTYRDVRRMEREKAAAQRRQAAQRQAALARARYADLMRQSAALQQKVPGFDLNAEMAAPHTRPMLLAGVPLETVYAFNHRRELTAAAAAVGAERVAAGVAANQSRPAEAGAAGTGSASAGLDPARLTRAQREDIKRRVANGERIVLSDYAPK